MSRISCRLTRKWLLLATIGVAMLGVLTACAGPSLKGNEPASTSTDNAPAAPPEKGPQPVEDTQRDVVKTASMIVTVANTSEAADKAAVMVEDAGGRVDSRTEDAGSEQGLARTSIVLRVPVGGSAATTSAPARSVRWLHRGLSPTDRCLTK